MTEEQTITTDFSEAPVRVSELRRIMRVFLSRKVVMLGLVIILANVIAAIFAPVLAPYEPNKIDMTNCLSEPTWEHPLGTDAIGRDTLSRVIYGSRTALLIGISSIGAATIMGMTLGLIAGYFGKITNTIIMRFTDALMAFPMILLALSIAALLGGGLRNIVLALGFSMMSIYTRLICGQVLSVKENDYVMATKSVGAGNLRMLLYHILPNCLPPLIVLVTLMIGAAILAAR